MSEFAKRFKELRKQANLTQDEMARKLNTSRSRIGMYETGKREPDHETLEQIADFFNVDIDYLLGRTNKSQYYLSPEAAQAAQMMFERKEMRVLFDIARDATPEDILTASDVLLALKRKETHDDTD